jgi:hypothetical protein
MTSILKIESNKKNASRSTGPRTPGGKSRSSTNARRHGLATRVEADPETKIAIESLAAVLAEGSDDFVRTDQLHALAECHFDRRRIRAARYEVFLMVDGLENAGVGDFETAVRAIQSMSRYDTRAFSKMKGTFRKAHG